MRHILVAVVVLFVANIANAGDSWVLWEGTMSLGSGRPYEWKIIAAFPES